MRIFVRVKLFACTVLITTFPSVKAASFDCKKAASSVEKLICLDSALSGQDDKLNKAYIEKRNSLDDGQRLVLKNEQRTWIRTRNECTTSKCIQELTAERILQLTSQGVDNFSPPLADSKLAREVDGSSGLSAVKPKSSLLDQSQEPAEKLPPFDLPMTSVEVEGPDLEHDSALLAKWKSLRERSVAGEYGALLSLANSLLTSKGLKSEDLKKVEAYIDLAAQGLGKYAVADSRLALDKYRDAAVTSNLRQPLPNVAVQRPQNEDTAHYLLSCSANAARMMAVTKGESSGVNWKAKAGEYITAATVFSNAKYVFSELEIYSKGLFEETKTWDKDFSKMMLGIFLSRCESDLVFKMAEAQPWAEAARGELIKTPVN